MTAIAGYGGSVKLGANQVAEIDKWDLTIDSDIYDVTQFGSSWKQQIPGLKKWQGTFAGRLYEGDATGQAVLQAAILGGVSVSVNLYTDAVHNFSGTVWLKSMAVKTDVKSSVDVTFNFEGSGALSYS